MKRSTALSILGACAASLAAAAPALATFPGDNGAIAFSRDGDIWTINPDGTGEKRLTSGSHIDSSPEWSPDGRELLFERSAPSTPYEQHIYRMKADGSGVTWIRAGRSPQFSPDGKRFAFSGPDADQNVLTAGLDGSNVQQVTHEEFGGHPTDWSPINDLILSTLHNNITYAWAESSSGARLNLGLPTRDPGPDYVNYEDPSWSPDGTRIAIGSLASAEHSYCWSVPTCSDPLVGLIVTDLAGNYRVIRQGQALGRSTTWSPDGTSIAYTAGDDSIHIIRSDGTSDRALVKGNSPDWQPLEHQAPAPPTPPAPQVVTVKVPVEVPGPVRVVEKVVTRTVTASGEVCPIPKGQRLTLTIRATRAIKKGALVRVAVDLRGATPKVKVPNGIRVRSVR